jgi:hypothetical protein
MQFNYFEEFPTDENLEKARDLKGPGIIFLACPDLLTFMERAEKLSKINGSLKAGYWPVLDGSYWISPFGLSSELDRLSVEIASGEIDTMLFDLELPLLEKSMFLSGLSGFSINKQKIRSLFREARKMSVSVYTAEYPATGPVMHALFRLLGISYPDKEGTEHIKIIMFYPNSLLKLGFPRFALKRMKNYITKLTRKYPSRIEVGLGTIGKGKITRESTLNPEELSEQIKYFSEHRTEAITLFRLGEMTPEHFEVAAMHINK